MRRLETLVLLSTLPTTLLAASPLPRGVGPEFAKFYGSGDTFACIGHPSIVIPISALNDDYCDCPDGSDEPGTAACTYLSSQPQSDSSLTSSSSLPGFWCANKGHLGAYVPHMYVNDGKCDYELCCDGSDEWAGVGGVKCEDRCGAMGKEWRKAEEVRRKAMRGALGKKAELQREATRAREAVKAGIDKLERELGELEGKAERLRVAYEDVERRERGRVVGSKGKGSKVTILAGLAKARVEELRESLLSVVGKRDKLRERVKELETILATFKEEYNPNFNDEGVKRAVKSWEDYAANKEDLDDSALERDIDQVAKPDSESEGINWAEWEALEEETDTEALYRFEEYLPSAVREWLHLKLTDFRIMLVENGILADNANSGSESKAVTDARAAYNTANDDLTKARASLEDARTDLDRDYGPAGIFRALNKACVSKDSGEYTYELCWMDKTTQKSKKGGGNTGMGNFVRFGTMEVDEEVGADGKGLGKGERTTLHYENGQHCWNGPNRQTTVVLGCAEKDEIWKVWEQEKCMYRMDVGTPAVCEETEGESAKGKDEL